MVQIEASAAGLAAAVSGAASILADPLAAAAERAGPTGKLVGYVGHCVPIELILAAGCTPLPVGPQPAEPTPLADRYMEPEHEPEIRSLYQQALAGRYAALDLFVATATSDGYGLLYPYLKEAVRIGAGGPIPPLHLYDLMFGRTAAVREHSRRCTRELLRRLEVVAARRVSDAELCQAVARTNARRAALARFDDVRRRGLVRGADALQLIAAGHFLTPEEHIESLEAAGAAVDRESQIAGAARVALVPAAPLFGNRLHAAIESAGALVVTEDDAWGARSMIAEIAVEDEADPAAAIADAYYRFGPSPRMPSPDRDEWFCARALAEDIDLVIFHVPPSDRFFGWTYPGLKGLAQTHGKRTLLLRHEADETGAREQIAGAVASALRERAA